MLKVLPTLRSVASSRCFRAAALRCQQTPRNILPTVQRSHFHRSAAMETIKMLVLETDSPHPDTFEEVGSFGQVFKNVFTTAGANHDPPLGVEVDSKQI